MADQLTQHLDQMLKDLKGDRMTTLTDPALHRDRGEQPEQKESLPVLPDPTVVPKHDVSNEQWAEYGNFIKETVKKLAPNPILLLSGPGSGKTQMMKLIAEELNYRRIGLMFNAQSPAKVVFGGYYPPKDASKSQILEWIDGRMVAAMRPSAQCQWKDGQPKSGCVCPKTMIHVDEFNRQEEDVQVRWLTVLEDTGRWMHLVEHHQEEFAVHPNVWVTGTMNPESQSASINAIEPALLDRLRVIEVEKPMVNEIKVLNEILPNSGKLPELLLRMATDSRRNPSTAISTRALIMVAKSMVYGLKLNEAIKVNIMNTTVSRDDWPTIDSLYNSFFGTVQAYGGKVLPSKTGL